MKIAIKVAVLKTFDYHTRELEELRKIQRRELTDMLDYWELKQNEVDKTNPPG